MKQYMRMAALAIGFGLFGISAQADTITLNSIDGSVTLSGEIVAVQDGFYSISTVFGELLISIDQVVCIGDACAPKPDSQIVLNG